MEEIHDRTRTQRDRPRFYSREERTEFRNGNTNFYRWIDREWYKSGLAHNLPNHSLLLHTTDPQTLPEWEEAYLAQPGWAENLNRLTHQFWDTHDYFSFCDCAGLVACTVFDQTFIGYTKEKETLAQLERALVLQSGEFLSIGGVGYETDRSYGLDAIGVKRDGKIVGFQLKSGKWFHPHVQLEKKRRAEAKFDQFRAKYGAEVFYVNEDAVLNHGEITLISTREVNLPA